MIVESNLSVSEILATSIHISVRMCGVSIPLQNHRQGNMNGKPDYSGKMRQSTEEIDLTCMSAIRDHNFTSLRMILKQNRNI